MAEIKCSREGCCNNVTKTFCKLPEIQLDRHGYCRSFNSAYGLRDPVKQFCSCAGVGSRNGRKRRSNILESWRAVRKSDTYCIIRCLSCGSEWRTTADYGWNVPPYKGIKEALSK